jgi:hypothetical protein
VLKSERYNDHAQISLPSGNMTIRVKKFPMLQTTASRTAEQQIM